jgi:hypothetical protein
MANVTETATFDAGVYRIENNDFVIGGEDGIANKAVKNLANRTLYLKEAIETEATNRNNADADLQDQIGIEVAARTAADIALQNAINAAIDGLKQKPDVMAATTANITLSGTQTVDGIALSVGHRVLVKSQTTPSQNGIYVVALGSWTRPNDANTGIELQGAVVSVETGTVNADTTWRQISDNITIGTTSISFLQFLTNVPDATATTKGKAKLYTSLGSNTDGAPDQNTVNEAFNDLTNAWQYSSSTSGTTCPIATITAVHRKWNVTLNKVTLSFIIELSVTGSNQNLNVNLALPVNAGGVQYDISTFAIRNLATNINTIGSMSWLGGAGNSIDLSAVNGVVNFPPNNYRLYGQITYEKA